MFVEPLERVNGAVALTPLCLVNRAFTNIEDVVETYHYPGASNHVCLVGILCIFPGHCLHDKVVFQKCALFPDRSPDPHEKITCQGKRYTKDKEHSKDNYPVFIHVTLILAG